MQFITRTFAVFLIAGALIAWVRLVNIEKQNDKVECSSVRLEEDEVPLSLYDSALVDYTGGVGYYANGSTFDGCGAHYNG